MKKITLLLLIVALAYNLYGCSSSNNLKVESFESHLRALSDDTESTVGLTIRYNNTEDLEDAITKLCGYTSKDWYVSTNDAEDAWIYLSHYIDALHTEIDELYEEYQATH